MVPIPNMDHALDLLIVDLVRQAKPIRFGAFTLKSGSTAPIYVDLRTLVSYPQLLRRVSEAAWQLLEPIRDQFDFICGVPYAAVPVANCISMLHDVPGLLLRKEAKDHGHKKMVEGVYKEGDRCVVVEDVLTTGVSIVESINILRQAGLRVTDVLVLLDRTQGGVERLVRHSDLRVHRVFDLRRVLSVLCMAGEVDASVVGDVVRYLDENAVNLRTEPPQSEVEKFPKTYEQRLALLKHPQAKKLIDIVVRKQTNLCVAVDMDSVQQVLQIAKDVGSEICCLKLHADCYNDFSQQFVQELRKIADEKQFVLFEDRKFADTGCAVSWQFTRGFHINEWADIVTVHALPGPGVLAGLREGSKERNVGCLIVAEMSTQGTLSGTDEYKRGAVAIAKDNADMVCGFVCQKRMLDDPSFVYLSPGVNLDATGDQLGQQFRTPQVAIGRDGVDVIIVGRGITLAADVAATAKRYRQIAWNAYLECIGR